MRDHILVKGLEVWCCIGVPDEERSQSQRLTVSVALGVHPQLIKAAARGDDVGQTIDYVHVCERIKVVAAERPRRLIETLADDMATDIFSQFPQVLTLELEIEKFILPDAKSVGVKIVRANEEVVRQRAPAESLP